MPLWTKSAIRWLSIGVGVTAVAYTTYAAAAWLRYGHTTPAGDGDTDLLLDRVMPTYDIVERHHVRVRAPAEITFAAACQTNLLDAPVARAIFKARELLFGSEPDSVKRPHGLVPLTRSLGWATLFEVPGREIVMGAVTQPWEANVRFRGLPLDEFVAFDEPGYVKIAWTIRADPVGTAESIFGTETRAVATDAAARARFRRYWAFLSPGIITIRWVMLGPVKAAAEQRNAGGDAARR